MKEWSRNRSVFRKGFWGVKKPPSLGNFFNLLGFLGIKSQNPPKISHPYKKKFKTSLSKNSEHSKKIKIYEKNADSLHPLKVLRHAEGV